MQASEIEELFRRHAQDVHAAVYRLTLDAAAADDATQDAFVRLLTRPPKEQDQVLAWLKRVALNAALDRLRKRSRLRVVEHDLQTLQTPESEMSSDEPTSDGMQELLQALRELDPDQRAAVLAVDRDQMSYGEACDTLGVSMPKLKTDLMRGRRALAQRLGIRKSEMRPESWS